MNIFHGCLCSQAVKLFIQLRIVFNRQHMQLATCDRQFCCFNKFFFFQCAIGLMFAKNKRSRIEKKNWLNQQNWRSRVANCICCRLNTRSWMNYFTTWEQRHHIHLIEYNLQLTTYAVGHPQPAICLTQETFFSVRAIRTAFTIPVKFNIKLPIMYLVPLKLVIFFSSN